MKISPDQDGTLILEEVYNGLEMRTNEGNKLGVCMRDDTFEITTEDKRGRMVHSRLDIESGTFIVTSIQDCPKAESDTCGPGRD